MLQKQSRPRNNCSGIKNKTWSSSFLDFISRRISFYDLGRKLLERETYNEYNELTLESRINYNDEEKRKARFTMTCPGRSQLI